MVGRPLTRRELVIGASSGALAAACSSGRGGEGPAPTASRPTTSAPFAPPPGGRVPDPAGFVRTNWSADPFASGSYSAMVRGATPTDRAVLRRPLDARVFFAGEHTNGQYPATVHGALASGRRAADEVLAAAANGETVVVVGAGAAGLECAAALARAGMDVIVLEGRADRIGGRLWSPRPPGWSTPIDLGASWVHDSAASDLDRRLVAAGVTTHPWDWQDVATWDASGARRVVDDGTIAAAVDAAVERADEAEDDQIDLATAIGAGGALASFDPVLVDHYLEVEVAAEYGADADQLSARWALEEGTEGDDIVVVGYAAVLDALAEGLEVRLDHPVERVTRRSDGVTVTHRRGSLVADRVVVTVPLGVLRAGAIAFDPPLPSEHQAALQRLDMGLLDKVWLRWDRRWWREEAAVWTLAGDATSPYVTWINLAAVGGHATLLGLVGGRSARSWAGRSDDEVRRAAMAALQQFLDAGW